MLDRGRGTRIPGQKKGRPVRLHLACLAALIMLMVGVMLMLACLLALTRLMALAVAVFAITFT